VSATSVSNSTNKTITVTCPGSKIVVGGGGTTSLLGEVTLSSSFPVSNNTWSASGFEEVLGTANNWTVTAYAICINP
jgi:hypothetical protein